MNGFKLAFDGSSRRTDDAGRLHIDKSHISKATVNPYYGQEIPGFEALGLEPTRVYKLLRDPAELEKAAPTFAKLQILSSHEKVTADEPKKDLVVGSIGSNVAFDSPYLDADLCIWDAAAIAGIETGKIKELSCSYWYDPVMEPGEFEGVAYDGRMTNIRGNHLALVETGRAGGDVVVADNSPFPRQEVHKMQMTRLGKALFVSLCAASAVLAKDSALPALVGNADRKSFDAKAVKAKLIALDATMDPQKLDNVIDALLDVEQEPKPVEPTPVVKDESPADKIRKMLAGKVEDAVIDEIVSMLAPVADEKPEDVKTAMDAAITNLRSEFKAAADAARDVRHVVGDVAMDSAADIYGFALDHLKVDRKGVEGVPALRALFKVAANKPAAPTPIVATDSADTLKRFPAAARFQSA